MDITAKKSALVQYLAAQGIFAPADQEAEINKMASQYPAAKAAEEGLTDPVELAYAVMTLNNPAPTGTQPPVSSKPISAVSDAEKLAILDKMSKNQSERDQKTRATSIEKLLLAKPSPQDIIAAGTTGVLKVDAFKKSIKEKIDSGVYILCPDDDASVENGIASTTNYNQLVAAMENPEAHPFAVYRGQLNTRPTGYVIKTPTVAGGQAESVQMTRSELEKFIVLQVNGYILAPSADMPGAAMRYIEGSTDAATNRTKDGRTVVVDKNKKEAIARGAYDVVTAIVEGSKKVGTAKTDIAIKVQVAGKTTKKGENVYRTLRASLSVEVPELEVKAAYVDKFETKASVGFTEAPTGEQATKLAHAQLAAMANLIQKASSDPISLGSDLELVKSFMPEKTQQPAVTM